MLFSYLIQTTEAHVGLRGQVRARPRDFVRISANLYSTHSLMHTRLSTSFIMFCSYRAYHDRHHFVHYRNTRLACDCVALN